MSLLDLRALRATYPHLLPGIMKLKGAGIALRCLRQRFQWRAVNRMMCTAYAVPQTGVDANLSMDANLGIDANLGGLEG